MKTIDIQYQPGVTDYQQDAAFYVGNYHDVATISYGDIAFGVYVSGDTRAYVWNDEIDKAGEEEPAGRVWNDGSKWAEFGVHNDEDLRNAEARTEWVNNSWYELYELSPDSDDRYDGQVFHTHEDAVRAAADLILARVGNLAFVGDTACITDAPLPFTGSAEEIAAAADSHDFWDGRCINCDSKSGFVSSEYPCGAVVPRRTYIRVREIPITEGAS